MGTQIAKEKEVPAKSTANPNPPAKSPIITPEPAPATSISDATPITMAVANFWEKVMLFSRTHAALSPADRTHLDGVVVAAATMMSDLTADPDLTRIRVQVAVSRVDDFNNAHGTLQHPDSENWDAIVGAVNALAVVANAGPGTVKRP